MVLIWLDGWFDVMVRWKVFFGGIMYFVFVVCCIGIVFCFIVWFVIVIIGFMFCGIREIIRFFVIFYIWDVVWDLGYLDWYWFC